MPADLTTTPLFIAAIVFGVLGAVLVLAGFAALWRARVLGFVTRALFGGVLVAIGALSGAIAIGMQGYAALAREDLAARVSVAPTAPQRFTATLRFSDGREAAYALAGDEIYIDAHILKWKPFANLLGLHTSWRLDRLAGRYRNIDDERSAPRTLHALGASDPIDLFTLRRRHAWLAPLYDAEYGSATFVPVGAPAELELRVSTSGLLLREVKPAR